MSLIAELHPQAHRIAGLLRERGEKVAVADGATGGARVPGRGTPAVR